MSYAEILGQCDFEGCQKAAYVQCGQIEENGKKRIANWCPEHCPKSKPFVPEIQVSILDLHRKKWRVDNKTVDKEQFLASLANRLSI